MILISFVKVGAQSTRTVWVSRIDENDGKDKLQEDLFHCPSLVMLLQKLSECTLSLGSSLKFKSI